MKENNNDKLLSKMYTKGEEIANSITHGVGILFGIVALVVLLIFSIRKRYHFNSCF